MPDTCRSCGAPMLWSRMRDTDKSHPLDPDPIELLDLKDAGIGRALLGLVAVPENIIDPSWVVSQHTTVGDLRGHVLHNSHFVTCPDSDQWRGERRNEGGDEGRD